ncbi:MAG TPA: FAD-dependent monooxygenase [Pirellulales bacterium]|nr:FAD-dependent monooxygenase [Pirellulales bacterium]
MIVIGAGPAGAVAARQLARLGKSVLLVDKASFPRYKVCGCCLNATAAEVFERIGLGHLLRGLGARPIDQFALASGGRVVSLPLVDGGFSVSREALDAALVREAIVCGVEFIDGVQARLSGETANGRTVQLSRDGRAVQIATKVVIAADGLRGSLLDASPDFHRIATPDSLVGIGTTLEAAPQYFRAGTIYMAVAQGGYVGQVRLEDGRLDVAGAVDRRLLADANGPAQAAKQIVEAAGFPWPSELSALKWHGTPPLTRRLARVAGRRLFVIGDAAAYVEPFTGEGMAWAMLSACAVAPIVSQSVEHDSPRRLADRWEAAHRQLLVRRMLVCRGIGKLLRSPRLARAAIVALHHFPSLAAPLVRYFSAPPPRFAVRALDRLDVMTIV